MDGAAHERVVHALHSVNGKFGSAVFCRGDSLKDRGPQSRRRMAPQRL